jgi:hypothetical protein
VDLARTDVEREVVDRENRAEALRDPAEAREDGRLG